MPYYKKSHHLVRFFIIEYTYCSCASTSPAILIDGVSVFAPSAHFAGQAVPG